MFGPHYYADRQCFNIYNSPINKVITACWCVSLIVEAPSEEEAKRKVSEFIKRFNDWRASGALAGDSSLPNN
jgi:hypothetical protein